MISFPSTINESKLMYGSNKSNSYQSQFDISRIRALNLTKSVPVIKEQLKDINIVASNFQRYPSMNIIDVKPDDQEDYQGINYENPLQLPANIIALAKDYEWIYKYRAVSVIGSEKLKDGKNAAIISQTTIVPSMFNPMYGVSAVGLIRNTPLLNDYNGAHNYPRNIDDCTIRTLCTLSKNPNSEIGMHRYKYADFMYCKDLGKVSNNHLITLRKFAHPVPDHIGIGTTYSMTQNDGDWSWKTEGDIGRLITWFGTDDNKLEDIATYSYNSTWRKLDAEIEQQDSRADDQSTGILGMISNTTNASYNRQIGQGFMGNHSGLTFLGSKLPGVGKYIAQGAGGGQNMKILSNYDKYKVYEPKNTIQSNHIYEGKIEFSHEFTLKFSYELRAYDNINPRSAFLDLIGNILEVTHRRGKFWGGSRKLIGPAQNTSIFNKVYNLIDKSFDRIPGFISSFIGGGGDNFSKFLSSVSNIFSNMESLAQNLWANKETILKEFADATIGIFKNGAIGTGIKNLIKGAFGVPQIYAWHSLVSGDDVGLWHVTVGNPRNPILSIGNLILTKASISHSGPLGIDDFPTQLTVSVTLQHPRPRDTVDIGRMYTGGTNALYHILTNQQLSTFYNSKIDETKLTQEKTEEYKYKVQKEVKVDKKEEENKEGTEKDTSQSATETKTIEVEETKTINYTKIDIYEWQKQENKINKGMEQYSLNGDYNLYSSGIPDPTFKTPMDVDMMRKNTWNDLMFITARSEVA